MWIDTSSSGEEDNAYTGFQYEIQWQAGLFVSSLSGDPVLPRILLFLLGKTMCSSCKIHKLIVIYQEESRY